MKRKKVAVILELFGYQSEPQVELAVANALAILVGTWYEGAKISVKIKRRRK